MKNALCRFNFHSFTSSCEVEDSIYIICVRCGDSRHLHTSSSDDEGDPLELPDNDGNVIAFARQSA